MVNFRVGGSRKFRLQGDSRERERERESVCVCVCVCVCVVAVWLSIHDCSYNPDLEERYIPPPPPPSRKVGKEKRERKKKNPHLQSGPDWRLSSQGT